MNPGSFKDFVLDQLAELPGLECRAMFGGHGLYGGKAIFGIVFKGRLYFKTSAVSRAGFTRRGMKPFRPNVRQRLNSYYEVPAGILEDRAALAAWARRAIGLSIRRPAAKQPPSAP